MHIILEDIPEIRTALLPLTFTRPCAELPAGIIDTISERWHRLIPDATIGFDTEEYLRCKFPRGGEADVTVVGHVLPDADFARAVSSLQPGQWIANDRGECIARSGEREGEPSATLTPAEYRKVTDIFGMSRELLTRDFAYMTAGRTSAPLSPTCTLIGPANRLFIEEGATVEGVFINTTQGPVYIGRDSDVQESAVLRGPVAIGRTCRVRAGAKLLSGTNVGNVTRVGGEISNAVFLGYSNKQHDGFLGDAVIGHWVNLGAGCVASNLKNDYAEIRLWSYASKSFPRTGLQFCGLIMGDHSKAGINTTFNTASTVGVACNVYGPGFPRTYIPSFSDGGAAGFTRAILRKVLETARIAMSHRGVDITDEDKEILTYLYNHD